MTAPRPALADKKCATCGSANPCFGVKKQGAYVWYCGDACRPKSPSKTAGLDAAQAKKQQGTLI